MLSSLTNQLHHFIRKDLSSSRFWHQKAQDILKFLYFVRKDIGEKYCLQRASGMAYTSLMAMVPTLIVFVSVFSSVKFFPAHVKGKIEFLIFQNFIPETSQKIADKIAATIQTFTSAAATIGLIGAVFMVLSVFFLLNTIEHIFNSIMEAEKERTLLHKLSAYTTIMVWSALLTGLSMYFASQTDIVKNIPFIDQLNAFFHYGFIVIAFTLAYKMIPNKSIATRNAFAGGIVATILWEIARKGFSNYTSKLVGFDQIYGTLGIIPLFLLWLYLVWMVLLIGMEVTYVSQNWRLLNSNLQINRATPDLFALKILKHLGQCYVKGRFVSEEDLMRSLSLSEHTLKYLLQPLIKNQLIAPLDNKRFSLAKAPEYIHLWSVVSLFHDSFQVNSQNSQPHEVVYLPLNIKLPGTLSSLNLSEWLKTDGN